MKLYNCILFFVKNLKIKKQKKKKKIKKKKKKDKLLFLKKRN